MDARNYFLVPQHLRYLRFFSLKLFVKNFKNHNVLYSAVVLTETSSSILLSKYNIPKRWKTYAHHMTIGFGKSLEDLGLSEYNENPATLKVTHVGKSEFAMAIRVEGFKSLNDTPHITIAVNVGAGGKPQMSNDITEWTEVIPFILDGVVKEIKR